VQSAYVGVRLGVGGGIGVAIGVGLSVVVGLAEGEVHGMGWTRSLPGHPYGLKGAFPHMQPACEG
jgi:hypothetical protein